MKTCALGKEREFLRLDVKDELNRIIQRREQLEGFLENKQESPYTAKDNNRNASCNKCLPISPARTSW